MTLLSSARRVLSSALCSLLVLLSPGLAPYEALAASQHSRGSGALVKTGPAAVAASISIPSLGAGLSAFNSGPLNAVTLPSSAGLTRSSALPGSSQVGVEKRITGVSQSVLEIGAPLGSIGQTQPGQAREAGQQIQDVLMGGRVSAHSDETPSVTASPAGFGRSSGISYAKPAGRDSIGDAAEAFFGDSDSSEPPISNGDGGHNGPNEPQKTPLIPKLLTAGLALLPAIFLGWPLIAAGAIFTGSLAIVASLGVVALPFMTERTPLLLRASPGVLIGALGLATLATGLITGAGVPIAMGALVALGGWGFVRFARNGKGRYDGTRSVIATFFGALGAVAGAGLVLLTPGGWIAGALTILAFPVSAALLIHLPGWVGQALDSAFRGVYMSVRDVHHVTASLRRDTVLRQRLTKYTSASLERSAWNAVWLGLLVWLPIGVSEAVQFTVGVLAGLAIGALRAPLMALWGASDRLKADSVITKFFAGWARASFWATKIGVFNRFEAPVIKYANSKNKIVSIGGALAIRALQLGWLIMASVSTSAALLGGWIIGLREAGKPYDAKRHDPESFGLGHDDLPSRVPDEEEPKVNAALPSKLLAVAIGLTPLYFLGLPLVSGGLLGFLAIAAALSVALMPMMPATDKFPKFLRRLPGTLLALTGGFTALGAARFLVADLPTAPLLALGAVVLLSGVGLRALTDKLHAEEQGEKYGLDEPEYIGGFVSALALMTGVAAALVGIGGAWGLGLTVAAYLSSPLLLYHLPKYIWEGVKTAAKAIWNSFEQISEVMGFWREETHFGRNLRTYMRQMIDRSVWNGALLVHWYAMQILARLVEVAVSAALSIAISALQAPTMFLWGAAYEKNPDSKSTRFWAGFNRFVLNLMQGSKKAAFDPWVAKRLIPAMNERKDSSAPTLRAMAALAAARVVQLYWIARLLALSAVLPAVWLVAVFKGIKRASGEKVPPADRYDDFDNPDNEGFAAAAAAPAASDAAVTAENLPGLYILTVDVPGGGHDFKMELAIKVDGTYATRTGFSGTFDPASAMSGRWTLLSGKFVGINPLEDGEQRTEIDFAGITRGQLEQGVRVSVKSSYSGLEKIYPFNMREVVAR